MASLERAAPYLLEAALLVKTTISAAGANFAFGAGQEFEWDALKALVGNGAENFCTPVDPSVEWPPNAEPTAAVEVADEAPTDEPVNPAEPETPKRGRRK